MATYKDQATKLASEAKNQDEFRSGIIGLTNQFNAELDKIDNKSLSNASNYFFRQASGATLDLGQGYSIKKLDDTPYDAGGSAWAQYEVVTPYGTSTYKHTGGNLSQNLKNSMITQAGLPTDLSYNSFKAGDYAKSLGVNNPLAYTDIDRGSGLVDNPAAANQPVAGANAQPKYGDVLTVNGQKINPNDTNYKEYADQLGIKQTDAATPAEPLAVAGIDQSVLAKPGIANLVASGQPFTETDAKNFAYASGNQNWQQYVGGVGGQANPLYIGSSNWSELQKKYTPYQLEQSTIRTNSGIYWNQNVNVSEVPKKSPEEIINDDAAAIANLVSDAKATADKYTKKTDAAAGTDGLPETPKDTMMEMLNSLYGDTAESLYNELYNTAEIKTAKADVIEYKEQLDEYDDQLDELKNDIRREVEGEASESYISALATVRGGNILKLQKQAQRGYETAVAILTNAREEAGALLQVKMNDNNNRYNRLFSMLQLQVQQEGTQFNQQMALLTAAQQIPEGRSITLPDGTTVKGMKENDNLNVVQFTDASKKTYVIGVDKKTGQEVYRTFIGNAPSSGSGSENTLVKQLAEYKAGQELEYQKEMDDLIGKGDVDISYDEKGNSYYYDKKALEEYNSSKSWWNSKRDPIDYRL